MARSFTRCTLKKSKTQKIKKTAKNCRTQTGGLFDTKGEKFYKEILINYKTDKYIIKYMVEHKMKAALKKLLDDRHDDIEQIKQNIKEKIDAKIKSCKSKIEANHKIFNRNPHIKNKEKEKKTITKNNYNTCISSLVSEINQMKAVTTLQTGQQPLSGYQQQQYYRSY